MKANVQYGEVELVVDENLQPSGLERGNSISKQKF